ncbi:MAG: thiolase family protein [Firmicutes bacterium]|nr:thiolase family protein [Dethiobacter sp.]MBS3898384.1 thiolase family protein [Dethiobacter sp.]MCL5993645.1 thiolase family protein [Bacillota bacterium]
MREVVIVAAVRTPVGRRNGLLSGLRAEELAAIPLREVVRRIDLDAALVEDVIMGCVSQVGEQAMDVGRVAALVAGYPIHVPGVTLDRQCGSSQQALHFAAQAIMAGDMDVVVAAGVESMSRVPMGSSLLNVGISPALCARYKIVPQGVSAELIAKQWNLSRQELDSYSLFSHQRAVGAAAAGRFQAEIVPLGAPQADGSIKSILADEGPRPGTSLEKLSSLAPAFQQDGVVTAGNSSQISDGAAAVLLMSASKANELGLKPRARIVARVVVGSDPTLMLTGPIPATEMALSRAGLKISDIDIFEVNEAFASVPLAWAKELSVDLNKVNPNGGAIALGHPLGASGARLMTSMLHELERTGGRFGLQTMCEGYGMANATIIERLD